MDVGGIVDPACAVRIRDRQPLLANQRDQRTASADGLLDVLGKVDAGLHRHVHEHAVGAEVLDQAVVEAPGVPGGLPPPIADENLRPGRSGLGRPVGARSVVHASAMLRAMA